MSNGLFIGLFLPPLLVIFLWYAMPICVDCTTALTIKHLESISDDLTTLVQSEA